MEDTGSPGAGQPGEASIEEQLARYARDLQELFLQNKGLEKGAAQSNQMVQMRSHEVAALNEFLRSRLAELFEFKTRYSELLDALDRLDWQQPGKAKERTQRWVAEGRAFLSALQEGKRESQAPL